MTRYKEIREGEGPTKAPLPTSYAEETFDKVVRLIEGPLNDRAERLMKSKLMLVPLGVGWTVWARSLLALRDGKPSRLWRRVPVEHAKAR